MWSGVTSLEELSRVLGERAHDDDNVDPRSTAGAGAAASTAPSTAASAASTSTTTASATSVPSIDIPLRPAGPSKGQRVLVADDDPQMRRLIRGVLQREGYEVEEANDGLDTIDIVERGGVDLVVLDYDMPRLDGLGVLEELRAQVRTATVPVIMLTARNDEIEEKALDLGAQDYLTKPVQTRSLVARVKAVLKRSDT